MTLKQFVQLEKDLQQDMVQQFASFLLMRQALGINVLLYQLDGFYIEVFYDTKAGCVKCIKCFDSLSELEPYLKLVDLREIYALLK